MTDGETLEALLEEVRTTNQLLRVLVQPSLQAALEATLTRSAQREAYELSDGTRGTREIAQEVGASVGSISNWWRAWRAAGLASETAGGRVQHVLALSALGIPLQVD
jgi:hypothetical protein